MMGKKALAAAQLLVDQLQLHDQVTPEEFLRQREEALDGMFPTTQLLPGAHCRAQAMSTFKGRQWNSL